MFRVYGIFLISIFFFVQCSSSRSEQVPETPPIIPGAYQFDSYIPAIKGRQVGLVVNHTSLVSSSHLVDTLLQQGINIEAVFSPEHGFKGKADAGAKIEEQDIGYDFRVESLYGQTRKPNTDMLKGIDVMVFDMQDVGARFYTYISTCTYVMEACAEHQIPMIILDRPNPNGSYIDGPVLEQEYRSFVGLHPIPVVHGLTMGELAKMIVGEGWIDDYLDLEIIPIKNYRHDMFYPLPVQPSPNLPNDLAVALYPSLCFFEGTVVSIGRGTDFPFQVYGHPKLDGSFSFTPTPGFGSSKPKLQDQACTGYSYQNQNPEYELDLNPLLTAYQQLKDVEGGFFIDYFNTLAGTSQLREQIEAGLTVEEIKDSWQPGIDEYKKIRSKYLLYE